MTLTPKMADAWRLGRENGNELVRYPGGFWYKADQPWSEYRWKSFGATTVEGLVRRGAAEYSEWRTDGRSGHKFPVRVTMKDLPL